jgi:HAD superfamily phosphatase (TIGR01668 family)
MRSFLERFFRPDLTVSNVTDLKPQDWQELQVDAVLIDLDSTLLPPQALSVDPAVRQWLGDLQEAGIRAALLTNGRAARVSPIAAQLALPCFSNAAKPFPFVARRALRSLGLQPSRTALIGDQLFSDVLVAKVLGLKAVWVLPPSRGEPWMTRVKRPLERWLITYLNHRRPSRSAASHPR